MAQESTVDKDFSGGKGPGGMKESQNNINCRKDGPGLHPLHKPDHLAQPEMGLHTNPTPFDFESKNDVPLEAQKGFVMQDSIPTLVALNSCEYNPDLSLYKPTVL